MVDFIPYFAAFITVLFGVGFGYALLNFGKGDFDKYNPKPGQDPSTKTDL